MDQLLIEALADGEFHSGQRLGQLLGVSRTAVWKNLQKLDALGITIESIKGRGYRIAGGLELLSKHTISHALLPETQKQLRDMVIHQSLDSTNRYVADLGVGGDRVVCLAECQLQGRGRRGRSWSSPFGKNIYLSLGWQFEGGAASLEGLSLVVGLAVRRALGEGDGLRLKWPNDILFEGRKLAGILLEMQGDPSGQCQIVVGIGINAGMSGQQRPDIDQPWADAAEIGQIKRNQLVASVLNQVVPVLHTFSDRGFRYYREEWEHFDAYRDQPVRLVTPAMDVQGISRGVAENGALRIESNGRIQLYNGGEISLRSAK